ncbi:MAG TPA: type II toxin-antitoxin system RelE/ParE family toxin [Terriglobia bacterium]|nr:type II toxin-antitoxin system RelE/ParE family toxin [Terriglobia bacterium]
MSGVWISPPGCVFFTRFIALLRQARAMVKALRGDREELRLRVGDYRLFFVYTAADAIEVRRVLHRKEAYR